MKNSFPQKDFKLDKRGNSPALFSKKKIPIINDKIIKKLLFTSKKNLNCNVRICLHNNIKSKMHNMIVLLNKKNESLIHVHNDTDEVYQIIKGTMKVNIFNKQKTKKSSHILSKNKNFIIRVNSGVIHQTKPVTSYVIFCENRLKPLKRSK